MLGTSSGKFKRSSRKSAWRVVWYSVLIWILSIVISIVVILPWFYLAYSGIVLGLSAYYFRKVEKTLRAGLRVALFWFFIVLVLDFFELVVFNFADNTLFISDVRNWVRYALLLLTPVIYGLVAENISFKQNAVASPLTSHSLGTFNLR